MNNLQDIATRAGLIKQSAQAEDLSRKEGLVKLSAEEAAGLQVLTETLTPEEKELIAASIEDGKITPEEGVELIAAIGEERLAGIPGMGDVAGDMEGDVLIADEDLAIIQSLLESGQISEEDAVEAVAQIHEINANGGLNAMQGEAPAA